MARNSLIDLGNASEKKTNWFRNILIKIFDEIVVVESVRSTNENA